ncbi:MAG TPA: glycosyltransferase family 4 protein, partial [Ktedonobacteraceae bacterium]
MSDPRIYILIDTFHPYVGGAEKQALAQGQSLRKRGYEVTIITFRYERAWPRREVIEGVPVIRVAGMLLGGRKRLSRILQRLLYLLAMVLLSWTLWHHRRYYDVLHVYQLSLLSVPAALVCLLTNKPMIIAVRSAGSGSAKKPDNRASPITGFPDSTALSQQVIRQSLIGTDLDGLEHFGKLVKWFTCSLLLKIHAVIVTLSSRMTSHLADHGFRQFDTQLIPNGVNITRFQPTPVETSIDERARVVICVSQLRFEKGIDILLQAWQMVQEYLSQPSHVRLVIVGSGPMRTQFEAMVKVLDIDSSVEFTGLQSDVPAQLHRGNLAVLPSRWEGMPNAVLEAMACGLPCVATRVSGSEDIIQHGVNGLLVEPEDYQGLAQGLLTLLCNPALARQYGSAARTTIEQHYSLEHITDRYVELYQRIV